MNFIKRLFGIKNKNNSTDREEKNYNKPTNIEKNAQLFLYLKPFTKRDIGFKRKTINKYKLPELHNLNKLSQFLKFKTEDSFFRFTNKFINSKEEFYTLYKIKKRTGGNRYISEPDDVIKLIQKNILQNILYKIPVHNKAFAFVKGKSIIANAKLHTNKKVIFGYDIKNFFDNINYKQIYKMYRKTFGYGKMVSFILTQICTLGEKLPQGAITSPYISNLIFIPIDEKIEKLANKFNYTYSRYADNLFFSTNEKAFNKNKFFKNYKIFTYYLKKILKSYNLTLNNKKTFITPYYKKQKITGLIVNSDKVNIDKNYYKKVRAELHQLKNKKISQYQKLKIKGKLSFIKSVNKNKYNNLTKIFN